MGLRYITGSVSAEPGAGGKSQRRAAVVSDGHRSRAANDAHRSGDAADADAARVRSRPRPEPPRGRVSQTGRQTDRRDSASDLLCCFGQVRCLRLCESSFIVRVVSFHKTTPLWSLRPRVKAKTIEIDSSIYLVYWPFTYLVVLLLILFEI